MMKKLEHQHSYTYAQKTVCRKSTITNTVTTLRLYLTYLTYMKSAMKQLVPHKYKTTMIIATMTGMYVATFPGTVLKEIKQPKGRRNIGRPRKRWRDQLHLEDQGTGNMPNPSGT
jgi:hypothetical protein